jgi:hypothetical protein
VRVWECTSQFGFDKPAEFQPLIDFALTTSQQPVREILRACKVPASPCLYFAGSFTATFLRMSEIVRSDFLTKTT